MADEKSALVQLFEKLQGRPVVLELPHETPLIQDPVRGKKKMKRMTPEGEALMKLLQHLHGAQAPGPEDLHEDTEDVINRLPGDRMLGGDIIT